MSFWEKKFSHVPHKKFPERDYVAEAKDSMYRGKYFYKVGRYVPLSLIYPDPNDSFLTLEYLLNDKINKKIALQYEKKLQNGELIRPPFTSLYIDNDNQYRFHGGDEVYGLYILSKKLGYTHIPITYGIEENAPLEQLILPPKLENCPIGSWCKNLSPDCLDYEKNPHLLLLYDNDYDCMFLGLDDDNKFEWSRHGHHFYLTDEPSEEYQDKFFKLLKKKVQENKKDPESEGDSNICSGQLLYDDYVDIIKDFLKKREKENRKRKRNNYCVVCLDEEITHTFTPCGHMCVCENCAEELIKAKNNCPMCRNNIESSMKIYIQ